MGTRVVGRVARIALPVTAALAWLGTAQAKPPEGTALLILLRPEALPSAVGANGFVVAGTFFGGGGFHWMPTSDVTDIGGTQTVAVSRDGRTIVGSALDSGRFENAALWTGGTTWRVLGSIRPGAQPCDRFLSSAFDASDDGKVVVGLAWDGCAVARAFRWEESTGMVDLGVLGRNVSRASGVSGDGRVVVGFDEAPDGFRQGVKWVDGREQLIRGRSGVAVGEAHGANRDGSLIVGTNCNPLDFTGPPTAWAWTAAAGVTCSTVDPPFWVPPFPYQLLMQSSSDDGRVIGGALSFGLDAESVVWFDGEPVMLRDYLRSHGVPDAFEGWYNTGYVNAVSADGRILVGYGAGIRTFQGFLVVLPRMDSK
jgi:probable HAF family extracellular repeat protein